MVDFLIVIFVIGIVSAILFPSFLNQVSTARIKALNSLAGAIHSAVTLSESQYLSLGNSSNSDVTSISMNGTPVAVIPGLGYPAAVSGGIDAALENSNGFSIAFSRGVATFNFLTVVSDCYLTYTAKTAAVRVKTEGC